MHACTYLFPQPLVPRTGFLDLRESRESSAISSAIGRRLLAVVVVILGGDLSWVRIVFQHRSLTTGGVILCNSETRFPFSVSQVDYLRPNNVLMTGSAETLVSRWTF